MTSFTDENREVYGVEPICRVLPIAPSNYHDHAAKHADPAKLSERAKRDAVLIFLAQCAGHTVKTRERFKGDEAAEATRHAGNENRLQILFPGKKRAAVESDLGADDEIG